MSPKPKKLSIRAFVAVVLFLCGSFCFAESDQSTSNELGVVFDSAAHRQIKLTREDSGYIISLMGLEVVPFQCSQPDSNVPIALPCGPNPYSHSIVLFVVIADVDVEIELLNIENEKLSAADFGELKAGPYGVDFSGPDLVAGIYWVQVCHGGEPVGRSPYAYVGSE